MRFYSPLEIPRITTGPTPAAGFSSLYFKSDDALYGKNVSGVELLIGPSAANVANATSQVACSSSANPTSTSNVTISGLSISVAVPNTSSIYLVTIDADITITSANTTQIIELLVDGTAQTPQLITGNASTAIRVAGSKTWLVTGLTHASHTFTARTRNSANSTNSTVSLTHTLMTCRYQV